MNRLVPVRTRRSTVLSLPLWYGFPGQGYKDNDNITLTNHCKGYDYLLLKQSRSYKTFNARK